MKKIRVVRNSIRYYLEGKMVRYRVGWEGEVPDSVAMQFSRRIEVLGEGTSDAPKKRFGRRKKSGEDESPDSKDASTPDESGAIPGTETSQLDSEAARTRDNE